jgi:diguanylate cyclase (GGDEF)-like protein
MHRYHHPVRLIMLDIDDVTSVDDMYGQRRGDALLLHVARVLGESSPEPDTPARYGGEEMAPILSHTDLERAYVIAERMRSSVGALRIPRTDEPGFRRGMASLGVAASTAGDKAALSIGGRCRSVCRQAPR